MKTHFGVKSESGLVHPAGMTTGKVHDTKVMANLIREDDKAVYGDTGYASDEMKHATEEAGELLETKEKAKLGCDLTKHQRARNRHLCWVRAEVEHKSRMLKRQFGYRKCAIAVSPTTARIYSRCWRSRTFSSRAGDLRPLE